jgi:hypothetical protein
LYYKMAHTHGRPPEGCCMLRTREAATAPIRPLCLQVSPAIQIEAPAADAIAVPTLAEGTPSATSLTAQAAAAPVK